MADPLWHWDELVRVTGGRAEGAAGAITGISIDTRTLAPGDLFVAIRGDHLDGHDFVENAFACGAVGALVGDDYATAAGTPSRPLLRVGDPLAGLGAIARAARARTRARVIAVTGSVGKTGTKEALKLCLSALGRTHAAEKSYNNQWGVPLTLARTPAGTDYGVYEIGMNHPGEITPLTAMVRPHVALVTNVEAVHLGYFSSIEEIADAKAEIFAGLEPGGTAILNRDNRFFDRLAGRAHAAGANSVLSFGEHPEADARLISLDLGPDGSTFEADVMDRRLRCRLGAPGRHVVQNALGVLAGVAALGGDVTRAAPRLAEMRSPKGRGARTTIETPAGPVLLIDESYNANPASMRAALAGIRQVPRASFPRRVVILADMLELGRDTEQLHRALLEPVVAAGIDRVHACGPAMGRLFEVLPDGIKGVYASSAESLGEELAGEIRAGDVVMAKGSLASRVGPLVDRLVKNLRARR